MIALKRYQQRTLDALEKYLRLARVHGPADAFQRVVAADPTDARQYYNVRWGLADVPFVCLRIPTGGGKTLLAAHAVRLAAAHYMERDRPTVLWLVPTTAILDQTLAALKRPGHPYRDALDAAFGVERVAVFALADAANIRPKDLSDKCCVILATMQSLRVSDRNKDVRKVYGDNESYEEHFGRLPNADPDLDRKDDENRVLYSFVNLLHQVRPLVILDEAHKAVSDLSGEVMRRVNPACVVEMTATPVDSNILYRVYASDLKAEDMVKLPFLLTEHDGWEQAVNGAVATRRRLAELAAADPGEYLRPLVLLQATKKDREVPVDALKRHLIENENVPEAEIAVATGDTRGLVGVDLFDPRCPVNYVITVEALKEGWDCSFAYVFCSVANVRSAVDVEQLLGRVMRMPHARRRAAAELNHAYAHVVSPSFAAAAESLHSHLLNMGFSAEDAERGLVPAPRSGPGSLWDDDTLIRAFASGTPGTPRPLELDLDATPDLSIIPEAERADIQIVAAEGGGVRATCRGEVSAAAENALAATTTSADAAEAIRQAIRRHRDARQAAPFPSPARRGETFSVAPLKLLFDGYPEDPEPGLLLAATNWSPLAQAPAGLTADEFRYDETARTFAFDLENERIVYRSVDAPAPHPLFAPAPFGENDLARWLDHQCRRDDVRQEDMLEFCRRSAATLARAGLRPDALARAKFALAAALRAKLDRLRDTALRDGYQTLLFGPTRRVEIAFADPHRFPRDGYAVNAPRYLGAYRFQKHYYEDIRDLRADGEEFDCARLIDMRPEVDWWVRNVDRKDGSFRLPLHDGWFYPDFVARLKDGRTLVVEYKGAHLKDAPENREKLNIGELWAERSGGRNLFLMAVLRTDAGVGLDDQLAAAVMPRKRERKSP